MFLLSVSTWLEEYETKLVKAKAEGAIYKEYQAHLSDFPIDQLPVGLEAAAEGESPLLGCRDRTETRRLHWCGFGVA